MTSARPAAGLVIGYSYLWSREAQAGIEEGRKDRPCAVILTSRDTAGREMIRVLPITHTIPAVPSNAILLPSATKARLGLDDAESWVVLTEINEFIWPGPDLRLLPRKGGSSIILGPLPPKLFVNLRNRFSALVRQGKVARIIRTE